MNVFIADNERRRIWKSQIDSIDPVILETDPEVCGQTFSEAADAEYRKSKNLLREAIATYRDPRVLQSLLSCQTSVGSQMVRARIFRFCASITYIKVAWVHGERKIRRESSNLFQINDKPFSLCDFPQGAGRLMKLLQLHFAICGKHNVAILFHYNFDSGLAIWQRGKGNGCILRSVYIVWKGGETEETGEILFMAQIDLTRENLLLTISVDAQLISPCPSVPHFHHTAILQVLYQLQTSTKA